VNSKLQKVLYKPWDLNSLQLQKSVQDILKDHISLTMKSNVLDDLNDIDTTIMDGDDKYD
jgi:hypothetical protein